MADKQPLTSTVEKRKKEDPNCNAKETKWVYELCKRTTENLSKSELKT